MITFGNLCLLFSIFIVGVSFLSVGCDTNIPGTCSLYDVYRNAKVVENKVDWNVCGGKHSYKCYELFLTFQLSDNSECKVTRSYTSESSANYRASDQFGVNTTHTVVSTKYGTFLPFAYNYADDCNLYSAEYRASTYTGIALLSFCAVVLCVVWRVLYVKHLLLTKIKEEARLKIIQRSTCYHENTKRTRRMWPAPDDIECLACQHTWPAPHIEDI